MAGIAATTISVALFLRRHRRRRPLPLVYELKGDYYQVLGHAWDHEVKDFKVVYRPLYHCPAAKGRFEAHVLAVSHFSRWEDKFRQCTAEEIEALPASVSSLLLPGPFWMDPLWTAPAITAPVPAGTDADGRPSQGSTRSRLGRRSHDPPLLERCVAGASGVSKSAMGESGEKMNEAPTSSPVSVELR